MSNEKEIPHRAVANTLKLYRNGADSNCLDFKHNLDPF